MGAGCQDNNPKNELQQFPNEQWLMETVFRQAGEAAARRNEKS